MNPETSGEPCLKFYFLPGASAPIIRPPPAFASDTDLLVSLYRAMVLVRAFDLKAVALQRTGRLVSKEQLVDHLCEWGEEVSNNAIEVYVHRLRKKIEVGGIRIATVRGLGYCLEKFNDPAAASSNAK